MRTLKPQGTFQAADATPKTDDRTANHVELRHISKIFGGVHALTDINLTIVRGSIHGFVGQNGAGKSTLGNIISGVFKPDGGEMVVDGRPVHYASPREALADGITIIAQETVLVPQLTALENVMLGREATRRGTIDRKRVRERFEEVCQRADFRIPPEKLIRDLSVADRQRVEILRALAREARLIVMDEPTAALTADDSRRLLAIVKKLRSDGTTIIFVSHILEDVLEVADTVTIFKDGRVVRTGAAKDENPVGLVQAMTGRSIESVFPERPPVAADAPVALSVRGLSAGRAVQDVSFDIHEGEILGLTGLIGAGRTECVRAIFGVDRKDAGTVSVGGQVVRIEAPGDAKDAGIAMIPESRKDQGLLMLRSTVENISLPFLGDVSRLGVIRPSDETTRAGRLIDSVKVAGRLDRPVRTLSGGNQQKVLFARWLFRRPKVLIADEPTRGVDVGAKRSIYEILVELASQGVAILLISSEMEEALGLAHRLLVMRAGRIVGRFDAPPFDEGDVMQCAFGTKTVLGAAGS